MQHTYVCAYPEYYKIRDVPCSEVPIKICLEESIIMALCDPVPADGLKCRIEAGARGARKTMFAPYGEFRIILNMCVQCEYHL